MPSYNFSFSFLWQRWLRFLQLSVNMFLAEGFLETPTLMRIQVLAFVLNHLNVLKKNKSHLPKILQQESIEYMMVGLCIVTKIYIYVCKKNDAETAQSRVTTQSITLPLCLGCTKWLGICYLQDAPECTMKVPSPCLCQSQSRPCTEWQ